MRQVIVRYKVKADRAAENEAYIRQVFEELNQSQPEGLRYATFKGDDGVSFIHIASIETEDGANPLSTSTAFKAFQAQIQDRCDEPPVAVDLHKVGSYRFFAD